MVKHSGNRNYLYINNGNGTFAEEAQVRGAAIETSVHHQETSIAFGDYDLDSNLDFYAGDWRRLGTDPVHARLMRNLGGGFFEDRTDFSGVNMTNPDGSIRVLSPRFTDLNGDGHSDLTIAADFEQSRLFWNNGDGTFVDGTQSPLGKDQNGMGSARRLEDWQPAVPEQRRR